MATLESATYALNASGEIWAWGFHQDWMLGFTDDEDNKQYSSPVRVQDSDCTVFKDIAASWCDGYEGLLAALSVDGELFACGNHILHKDQFREDIDGWCGLLTPIPTPEPVDSIPVTRAMPEEVGDGFMVTDSWNGEGRWLPDRDAWDQTDGEIAAGGLLALMTDGTVFAALQQQRVPGLVPKAATGRQPSR